MDDSSRTVLKTLKLCDEFGGVILKKTVAVVKTRLTSVSQTCRV